MEVKNANSHRGRAARQMLAHVSYEQAMCWLVACLADALHFALRIDTNKVPGELKKAYAIMEDDYGSFDPDLFEIFRRLYPELADRARCDIRPDSGTLVATLARAREHDAALCAWPAP